MHRIARILLMALAATTAGVGFQEARDGIGAERIRSHLYFLSLDALRGRAPGTRGGRLAGDYVASAFMGMGLQPVNGSYFQDVPLVGITTDPATLSLAFQADGNRIAAEVPEQAVVWAGAPTRSVQVDGELVFVGYGIEAPEWRWDDFKGRDLRGKVLVFLVGDPPAPPEEPDIFDGRALTYYGRYTYKLEEARRHGAAGALLIHAPETAGYGWDVVQTSWTGEQFLLDDGSNGAPVLLQGWLSAELAERVFAAGGLSLDELYVRAARRDFRPLATGIRVRSRLETRTRRLQTRNVVGRLPGGGDAPSDDVVLLTSHYDHLGVGAPDATGDSIYNGAYDNASGVAVLIEVARAFSRLEPHPRRGLLFMATAAEEPGLLGSTYYTRHPLVPLARTVAEINTDGASIWGETDDVIALGAGSSTLGEVVVRRAQEAGMIVSPDPAPENGAFFRSDQFPFARAGIPALFLQHGLHFRGRPVGWGENALNEYLARRYHKPSDQYDAAFNLDGAVQQARLLFGIGYDVAMAPGRPAWSPGARYAPRPRTR